MFRRGRAVLLGACFLVVACEGSGPGAAEGGEGAAGAAGAEHGSGAGADHAAAMEGGETLLAIMRQLRVDMDRASHGLWMGQLDSVAVAARAVADHPHVSVDERTRISGILGDRFPGFVTWDRAVHDAAVGLAEAAAAGDANATVAALGQVQTGCVSCHEAFREELRTTGSR